jgi:hypothetical protein
MSSTITMTNSVVFDIPALERMSKDKLKAQIKLFNNMQPRYRIKLNQTRHAMLEQLLEAFDALGCWTPGGDEIEEMKDDCKLEITSVSSTKTRSSQATVERDTKSTVEMDTSNSIKAMRTVYWNYNSNLKLKRYPTTLKL